LITTTILVLLGIVLAFVLWQMMRGPKSSGAAVTVLPSPATPVVELWTAKVGDVISIPGAAEDFSDLDFTVDQRNAYEGANRRWIDLGGDFRGRRVYLEVSRASGTEIMGLLDPRRLTLPEVGLTEDQLADLDSRQDPSASIQFEGKTWQYESSRELAHFENEGEQPKGLYRWLFAERGGSRLLCVEKWEGEPFDVRLARKLNAQDITVYRAA
jgi:Domain of unknown function (DUF4178)